MAMEKVVYSLITIPFITIFPTYVLSMIELLIVTQSGIDAKIENGVLPPWLKLSELDEKNVFRYIS